MSIRRLCRPTSSSQQCISNQQVETTRRGHEIFCGDGSVHPNLNNGCWKWSVYLTLGDGYVGACICQNLSNYALKLCILLYIKYTLSLPHQKRKNKS